MLRLIAGWVLIILAFSTIIALVVDRTPYLRCQSGVASHASIADSNVCAEPSDSWHINIQNR
ncbi:hypothetical protein QWZ04_12125 [Vibrio tapetis subsp. quintayensis]|uniref:hypothetical protein n=1 Tax=Vibrio tapetis TaxID=52443 RepID=UPI0025B467B9|nr:hypothetical protein [Vibrio tapetis]MDN3681069.1 hypothetical protein [Vibrio tapetis subsp. quintayensis]